MQRILGIIAGIGTQLLFLFTVWNLFHFLNGTAFPQPEGGLWIDVLLAVQFAVPHSLLLFPPIKKRLYKWIPAAFYGCFYCAMTCAGLLLTFSLWRTSPVEIWHLDGHAGLLTRGLFYASWVSLFYSLSLTGLGYQTGLTQWWHWLARTQDAPRQFAPRSLYRFLRHPVYLSFLGLLWFTPTMNLDRAVLTLLWTTYILIGSYLKDERLAFYIGAPYREYQTKVAGYPFLLFGPLGKRPFPQVPLAQEESIPLSAQSVKARAANRSSRRTA